MNDDEAETVIARMASACEDATRNERQRWQPLLAAAKKVVGLFNDGSSYSMMELAEAIETLGESEPQAQDPGGSP